MPYPEASEAQVRFFEEHGYLVVEDAIDPPDLAELESRCQEILDDKQAYAFDWAWEKGRSREERRFRIVQSSPTRLWPEINAAPFRRWAVAFGSALLRRDVEFWYDQFLAKPPEISSPTYWHQDEGYWGRNLDGRGVTCWMPLHDVNERNGCMHFIDGGHCDGVLEHHQPEGVQSDLITCDVDESRAVACPIALGAVTFHHGKTPHMTPANQSETWRRALSQHMRVSGSKGEGDHYPWKIYVNQFTGERIVPRSR